MSYETDLKFGSPKVVASLYDDDTSFLTLKSDLGEIFHPPFTTLPFVAAFVAPVRMILRLS